jgi:tetratricopeptide (TPR) repeat protein
VGEHTSIGDYELRLGDADAAWTCRRLDEAEHKFMTLSRDFSAHPGGFEGLARVAEARSDWQLALDRWDVCLARFHPERRHGWLSGRAWALFHLNRYGHAEAAFASIRGIFPQHQDGYLGMALSMFHQEKWEDAVQSWNLLFDQFSDARAPRLLLPYAKCLEGSGRPSEALAALSEILVADPKHLDALRHKSYLLLHNGKPDDAAVVNREALKLAPEDVDLLLQAVFISHRLQDMRGARKAFRSAVAAAESIQELDRVFRQTPAVFEGWERTSTWIELDQRLNSLFSTGRLDRNTASTTLALRLKLALRDYDGFLAGLDQASAAHDSVVMARLRETGKRLRAERFPDFDALKIFAIGLTKTGTTSLTRALGILGFHSTHYTNDLTCELLGIKDAFLFDALIDTSVCVFFEALYFMFPNSKFIYTVRPLESWAASFTSHYQRYHRSSGFDHIRDLLTTRDAATYGIGRAIVHGTLYHHHPDAVAAYQAYDRRVQDFFDANDRTRLLEFDIHSGDGWEKLCRFVDRPIPQVPFPWKNKAPEFTTAPL